MHRHINAALTLLLWQCDKFILIGPNNQKDWHGLKKAPLKNAYISFACYIFTSDSSLCPSTNWIEIYRLDRGGIPFFIYAFVIS